MKTRLKITNVAPAAAGNMQELRGKIPKGVAFVNDWMDTAELCAGCGKCQQQLLRQPKDFAWRGFVSPVTALYLDREALYVTGTEGFVHFSFKTSNSFNRAHACPSL